MTGRLKNPTRKGHDYEREVAQRIRKETGYSTTRRQSQGGIDGGNPEDAPCDVADHTVNGMPFDIECKVGINIKYGSALKQALGQCRDGRIPAVVFKKNGTNKHDPAREWAIIPLDSFIKFLRLLNEEEE